MRFDCVGRTVCPDRVLRRLSVRVPRPYACSPSTVSITAAERSFTTGAVAMPSAESDARVRRDEDARDAQGRREVAGVQRAGAAEGDEREVARVVAALDRDPAEGALHVRVGDAEDGSGGLMRIAAERRRDALHRLERKLAARSSCGRRGTAPARCGRGRHARR